MVKRLFLALAVGLMAAVAALLSAGCGGPVIGSGNPVSKSYDFKDFTKLEVSHAFEVQISRGDTFKVEVTVDENLVDRLRVEQDGATVRIGMETGINLGATTRRAVVVLPELEGVTLSGASKGDVAGFDSKRSLDVVVSGASSLAFTDVAAGDTRLAVTGAGKVNGSLKAANVTMEASGASHIELGGSAESAGLEASGASDLMLSKFMLVTAGVTLSGASSGTVNVADSLDADLSGASSLYYSGTATIGSIHTSGASKIERRD